MFRKDHWGIAVLVLGLFLSASASASANNKGKVTLRYDMVLQGKSLQAGEYTIRWESHSATATVTVSHGKHVLATAEAKLVERGTKYERNMVVFDMEADGTNTLREIRFEGSAQAIVFYE